MLSGSGSFLLLNADVKVKYVAHLSQRKAAGFESSCVEIGFKASQTGQWTAALYSFLIFTFTSFTPVNEFWDQHKKFYGGVIYA